MKTELQHCSAKPNPLAQTAAAERVWTGAFTIWALMWFLSFWAGSELLGLLDVSLNAHGHTHLYAHGHPFADARSWWGIPNTLDVLSNLPLVLAGLWGLRYVLRRMSAAAPERMPALLACAGLVMAGLGSATYHWHPVAADLVLDRLGMAVAFAGVLAWVMAERFPASWTFAGAVCVVVAGALSAALPAWTGQVLPWAVLQFGGLALVCLHAMERALRQSAGRTGRWGWLALVAFYVLAKSLELSDAQVYAWTEHLVAGHALKHLASACALPALLVFNRSYFS